MSISYMAKANLVMTEAVVIIVSTILEIVVQLSSSMRVTALTLQVVFVVTRTLLMTCGVTCDWMTSVFSSIRRILKVTRFMNYVKLKFLNTSTVRLVLRASLLEVICSLRNTKIAVMLSSMAHVSSN